MSYEMSHNQHLKPWTGTGRGYSKQMQKSCWTRSSGILTADSIDEVFH